MTDIQMRWRELKAKWSQDEQFVTPDNVVPIKSTAPKSKKMPKRIGKTARDRAAKALKASLAELAGLS